MVHIGEMPPALDEVLALLSPGDIVTHCFNGKPGGSIMDTPALLALARRLAAEGVLMDIGHGGASFSFSVARRAIGEGLVPYSISTDLHLRNLRGPVYDLATTASKVLGAGLPFAECVGAISTRPRRFLGLPSVASVGTRADFTLFDLADGDETVRDSTGETMRLSRLFEPRMAIIGAHRVKASRARP